MSTLRIGELARRTSLSPEVLRAWERRYGLLRPARSTGGYRLYSEEDAERVLRMQELISSGIAAAEAARLALEDAPAAAAAEDSLAELRAALDAFDDAGAQRVFDRLLARLTVETVLEDAVLPFLRELGERWERGEATVAQEHFASHFLRGRLLGLARGWDRGVGPRAVLACAPGEQHDLPLIVFGIALRQHGWRITFLGADVPVETLSRTATALAPAAVVVSATQAEHLQASVRELAVAGREVRLWIGGAAATPELAKRAGARLLSDGPLHEAAHLTTAA
jgi:MerR family transcriptional regulator, light-induced transcriptional regulator